VPSEEIGSDEARDEAVLSEYGRRMIDDGKYFTPTINRIIGLMIKICHQASNNEITSNQTD